MDLLVKMKEQYPHAIETMDNNVPDIIFDELAIMAYVGRPPVMHQSKGQGAIETSTYGADFMVMKMTVEQ
eukprot:8371535-Ditylum_brightwellii.AAC.1